MKSLQIQKCSYVYNSKDKYYTCLSKKDIIDIIKAYNIIKPNDKKIKLNVKKPKIELYYSLSKVLLKNEKYWYKYFFIPFHLRLKLKYLLFKPEAPRGEWGWLSSQDINTVVYQKTNDIKNFYFYGTFSSDHFKSYEPEKILKDFLKYKCRFIGVVFNTSPANKKGEHWVAIFIDTFKKTIDYFDPVGDNPNKYIKNFIEKFIGFKVSTNNIEYQKKDGTCGIYVIEYIIQKANNKVLNLGKDDIINKKRKNYFYFSK